MQNGDRVPVHPGEPGAFLDVQQRAHRTVGDAEGPGRGPVGQPSGTGAKHVEDTEVPTSSVPTTPTSGTRTTTSARAFGTWKQGAWAWGLAKKRSNLR